MSRGPLAQTVQLLQELFVAEPFFQRLVGKAAVAGGEKAEPLRAWLFVNCCFDSRLVVHSAQWHWRSRDGGIPFQKLP
jgi:hypothetical protein